MLQQETCILVIASGAATDEQKLIFKNLKLKVVNFKPEDAEHMKRLLKSRHLIWFGVSKRIETELIHPKSAAEDPVFIASRLLGGFVAGPEWLSFISEKNLIVQPLLRLESGMNIKQELSINLSIPYIDMVKFLMASIMADASRSVEVRWSVQERRRKL